MLSWFLEKALNSIDKTLDMIYEKELDTFDAYSKVRRLLKNCDNGSEETKNDIKLLSAYFDAGVRYLQVHEIRDSYERNSDEFKLAQKWLDKAWNAEQEIRCEIYGNIDKR